MFTTSSIPSLPVSYDLGSNVDMVLPYQLSPEMGINPITMSIKRAIHGEIDEMVKDVNKYASNVNGYYANPDKEFTFHVHDGYPEVTTFITDGDNLTSWIPAAPAKSNLLNAVLEVCNEVYFHAETLVEGESNRALADKIHDHVFLGLLLKRWVFSGNKTGLKAGKMYSMFDKWVDRWLANDTLEAKIENLSKLISNIDAPNMDGWDTLVKGEFSI